MQRRIFSPREIILPKAELARSAISWGKFSMPVFILACFFVFSHFCLAATYDIQWPDTGNDRTNFARDYIFQEFIPSASSISGIQLYFTGVSATINLCQGTLDTDMLLNNHFCANGTLIATTACTTSASPRWDYDFSDCPFFSSSTLVPGADYYYEIIGVWTRASGNYDYTYPGQTCGVQSDGSDPYCFGKYVYGYMVRNNLRTYSVPPVVQTLEPVILVPGVMGS
ncbi:MAG: hypothetical protein ABIB72_00100, partial [Candidatus Falkowbacteria bacterium]